MMRSLRVLLLGSLLTVGAASCAPSSPGTGPASGAAKPAELPAQHWLLTGKDPIQLKVEAGADGALTVAAAEPGTENLTLSFASRTPSSTMVEVKSRAPLALKFDLFISPNGSEYYYTSSCPLASNVEDGFSGFENWPHPIHSLAVGNIRSATQPGRCE
ncbi:MAG TPA: hypothetical protein VLC09_02895 [Polyangiaceae bacterium]|nr:hypothetical protein [Polyangiaceae bacterium]